MPRMMRARTADLVQEASDNSTVLISKSSKHKMIEQRGTFGKAPKDENQESNRKNNGKITENHKKLKARMTKAKTAGQSQQAPDNLTHPTNKPCK
eukprot:4205149-Ditylum_brightwellii.AAC.1